MICWLGRSLKCVKASGSGSKDNAWETAVCLVVDINFIWIWAPVKSWLLNELHWSKRVIVGYQLGYWHQKADNPKLSVPKPQWTHERKWDLKSQTRLASRKIKNLDSIVVYTNMALFFFFFFFLHLSLCDWWWGGAGNGFFQITLPPYSEREFPTVVVVKCF